MQGKTHWEQPLLAVLLLPTGLEQVPRRSLLEVSDGVFGINNGIRDGPRRNRDCKPVLE
jgi:hypothetical protein